MTAPLSLEFVRYGPADAQRRVDEWNREHNPGTRVWYLRDDGERELTRTRSSAWVVADTQPVVLLEDRTGGVSLSRVTPLEITAPDPRTEP